MTTLATSGTIEGIRKCIAAFYCRDHGDDVYLVYVPGDQPGVYRIYLRDKEMTATQVRDGKRFKFETRGLPVYATRTDMP